MLLTSFAITGTLPAQRWGAGGDCGLYHTCWWIKERQTFLQQRNELPHANRQCTWQTHCNHWRNKSWYTECRSAGFLQKKVPHNADSAHLVLSFLLPASVSMKQHHRMTRPLMRWMVISAVAPVINLLNEPLQQWGNIMQRRNGTSALQFAVDNRMIPSYFLDIESRLAALLNNTVKQEAAGKKYVGGRNGYLCSAARYHCRRAAEFSLW